MRADSGLAGTFVQSDVYDFLETTTETYDIAFASYGALPWLSDFSRCARGVSRILAPGGRLVVIEFHPILNLFDDDGLGKGAGGSGGGSRIDWPQGIGDYVAAAAGALSPSEHVETKPFVNPEMCHEWDWSVPEVFDAAARAGLVIEGVREWPYSNGCKFFSNMVLLDGKRWAMPEGTTRVPLMYAFTARQA